MTVSCFRDVLPSGLRVVTVPTPHLHSSLISAYVRAGSRHEQPANNGVGHFLEHMFFRGSHSFPDSVKMNAVVEEAGGNLNGVTTRDHGYYFTPLHPEMLEVGIAVLGDMLTRPLLCEMEVERQIILEEMLDEVDEKGRDIDLDNLSKMELFGAHPLALKIAGTMSSVRSLTEKQLLAHHQRHYVSGNMVLAAAGNVRREEVLALAKKHFAHLRPGVSNSERAPTPRRSGPRFRFVRHEEAQTGIRINFLTVPDHHPDFPALHLVRRVLDDGLSSRLPFNVVEKRGLAYSVHAAIETFDDLGIFEIDAACAPGKTAILFAEVCSTLAELKARPIGEDELERAKQRHRIHLEFSRDSPGELAGWFGGTELFRPAESFAERTRKVQAQSAADLQRVAARYFRAKNLNVVAVGQERGSKALRSAVSAAAALRD